MPKPFDKPRRREDRTRALSLDRRLLPVLPAGVAQAKALGVQLQVFDSRQDAALQADMVECFIALGVQASSSSTA